MALEYYKLEMWVNLVTLIFLTIFALPNIKIKKKDLLPILIVCLASLTTLFFDFSHHARASEFEYLPLAEGIAKGWGNIHCTNYVDGKCLGFRYSTRTSAFPLLVVPFIWLGLGVAKAGRIVNLILGTLSGAFMYLAIKEQVDRKKGLIGGLAFTILIPKLQLQFTALSEISSMTFLVISLYFMSRLSKSKDKKNFIASSIAISFFANIRPENFLGALPLGLWVIYIFFKKEFFKEKTNKFWVFFLCLNWLFASYVMFSQTDAEGWDWTLKKRIELFINQSPRNLTQLINNTEIANPVMSLLFVWGVINAVKDKNFMLIAVAFSFVILFGVYSSFDFDAFGLPRMLLLLTLISFIGSIHLPSDTLILGAFIFFSFALVLTNSSFHREESINDLYNFFEEDLFNISNESRPIYFTPEQVLHLIFPNKTFKAQDRIKNPQQIGGLLNGEAIYIYSSHMTSEVSIPQICNLTLLEEYRYAKKYLLKCSFVH